MKIILTLLTFLTVFSLNTFAENSAHTIIEIWNNGISFSSDGKMIASRSSVINLWDISTGKHKTTLTPDMRVSSILRDRNRVVEVLFSPDRKTLASRQDDIFAVPVIDLWDVDTGTLKTSLGENIDKGSSTSDMVFSPDGKTLIIAYSNRDTKNFVIRLWDVDTGALKATLEGHTDSVTCISLSANGRMLASGSTDNTIRLWDIDTATLKTTIEGYEGIRYAGEIPQSVLLSPDGRTLAGVSKDKTARLWDVDTGQIKATLEGHEYSIRNISFSPDGKTLATIPSSSAGSIRLWDVDTASHKATLKKGFFEISFSPDSTVLATKGWEDIYLYDVATGALKATLDGPYSRRSNLHSVLFSPDGMMLAAANSGSIHLWDVSTKVSITPYLVVSPTIGGQFSINVSIDGGKNIGGYQFTIGFNNDVLRYVESANGNYLPPGAFFLPQNKRSDTAKTFGATSLAGTANGDGTLATLTFEVLDIKESRLTLYRVILTDSDGKVLPHLALNGLVTDPQIGPEDVNSDGVINILDLVQVASRFNKRGGKEDINGDGVVNIIDLVKVAGALGDGAAAPSAWHLSREAIPTRVEVQQWLMQAQQLNLTDATSQRGIRFLEQLLAVLTPKETALLPNYPNPFNPETWIPYQLAEPADVSVSIYTMDGKLVRTLNLGHQSKGVYQDKGRAAYWDGRNAQGESVASGVYFYTLTAGKFTATRKMLICK